MAGLPGTGLGGIFYALLILWMTLREMWFKARGSGKGGRWPMIGRLTALLGGIVLALWGEGLLMQNLLALFPEASAPIVGALTPALAVVPFVILTVLLMSMQAARLLVGSGETPAEGGKGEPVMEQAA